MNQWTSAYLFGAFMSAVSGFVISYGVLPNNPRAWFFCALGSAAASMALCWSFYAARTRP